MQISFKILVLGSALVATSASLLCADPSPAPALTPTPTRTPPPPLNPDLQLPGASLDSALVASGKWHVNDNARPWPDKATPKTEAELADSAKPPADAIILFDGKDLSAWKPSKWKVENGYVEVVPKSGYLVTLQSFGSCHVHVEWSTPNPPVGDLQMKGNSGVFLMSRYEVQVLDTYDNPKTYADGIAGAIYGQNPPSSNPIRPPGEWQYYDIEFHRPIFDGNKLVKPATMTVYFNGILVQDHTIVEGNTSHSRRTGYIPHPDAQPLSLQEHGCADRFRNVWLVPIKE